MHACMHAKTLQYQLTLTVLHIAGLASRLALKELRKQSTVLWVKLIDAWPFGGNCVVGLIGLGLSAYRISHMFFYGNSISVWAENPDSLL